MKSKHQTIKGVIKKVGDKNKRPSLLDLDQNALRNLATHRGFDTIVSGTRKKKKHQALAFELTSLFNNTPVLDSIPIQDIEPSIPIQYIEPPAEFVRCNKRRYSVRGLARTIEVKTWDVENNKYFPKDVIVGGNFTYIPHMEETNIKLIPLDEIMMEEGNDNVVRWKWVSDASTTPFIAHGLETIKEAQKQFPLLANDDEAGIKAAKYRSKRLID